MNLTIYIPVDNALLSYEKCAAYIFPHFQGLDSFLCIDKNNGYILYLPTAKLWKSIQREIL